jgi:hypothetical protein
LGRCRTSENPLYQLVLQLPVLQPVGRVPHDSSHVGPASACRTSRPPGHTGLIPQVPWPGCGAAAGSSPRTSRGTRRRSTTEKCDPHPRDPLPAVIQPRPLLGRPPPSRAAGDKPGDPARCSTPPVRPRCWPLRRPPPRATSPPPGSC